MAIDPDCIFCKIAAGQVPAELLGENANAVAFRDIAPRQPIHILIVPRQHHKNVVELASSSAQELHDVILLANQVAADFTNGDFRITFNTGAGAGQTVFHAHAHVTAKSPRALA